MYDCISSKKEGDGNESISSKNGEASEVICREMEMDGPQNRENATTCIYQIRSKLKQRCSFFVRKRLGTVTKEMRALLTPYGCVKLKRASVYGEITETKRNIM